MKEFIVKKKEAEVELYDSELLLCRRKRRRERKRKMMDRTLLKSNRKVIERNVFVN